MTTTWANRWSGINHPPTVPSPDEDRICGTGYAVANGQRHQPVMTSEERRKFDEWMRATYPGCGDAASLGFAPRR